MPLDDIRNERLKKLAALSEQGIDVYPAKTRRTHTAADALKKFSALEGSEKTVFVAGRVMARREHGGSMFFDIRDGTEKIQVYFKKDVLGDAFDQAFETVDLGDIIEVGGSAFKTKRNEPSIEVHEWAMLSKALLPLPEKWHGLQDVEERFRRRYLDLLMNEKVRERFVLRSGVTRAIRNFFDKEGFLEVETPMFHPIPGGALAHPFITHHNALNIDLYLRVAPELYLKRLLVGGLDKVYELGKNFRNEGIDGTHNPEFTTVEWYASYWDEDDMMRCVEKCFFFVLKQLKLHTGISYDNRSVILEKKFQRLTFKEVLRRYALITDYDSETRDSLAGAARQFGIEAAAHESKGKIADEIFKKICRPKLLRPTFVTNHPLDISPLAKKAKHPEEVRRFQLIIAGIELVNAFSELNDPQDQRERFEAQEQRHAQGEEETHPLDEDFIEALEHGMPPAAGAAISIDRLTMLLTDTKNIREVVLFPTLRPR